MENYLIKYPIIFRRGIKIDKFMFNRLEYGKKWREENREYAKKYNKENWKKYYTEEKKEKARKYSRMYRKNNPELIKKYIQDNIEKAREWHSKYYQENKEKERQQKNYRRRTNSRTNLNHRMTTSIGTALKGNKAGRKWERLVGYTIYDLINRLKRTIPKGYTWQDFINGELHIDHIIPKSVFNYTNPEHIDFKRCWALENLRLLSARENKIKHCKLKRPFQPALKLIEGVI